MYTVHQSGNTIEFSNRVSPGFRVFIFLVGFFPLLAPYELLIKTRWESFFNLSFAFVLLISLGAIAISLFIFFIALMGMSQRLRFDGDRRVLTYGFSTAILPYRAKDHAFGKITDLGVEIQDWSDGPTTYDIRIQIEGERNIEFGEFEKREDADHYYKVLENLISSGVFSEPEEVFAR
jgi:hypothetical protein